MAIRKNTRLTSQRNQELMNSLRPFPFANQEPLFGNSASLKRTSQGFGAGKVFKSVFNFEKVDKTVIKIEQPSETVKPEEVKAQNNDEAIYEACRDRTQYYQMSAQPEHSRLNYRFTHEQFKQLETNLQNVYIYTLMRNFLRPDEPEKPKKEPQNRLTEAQELIQSRLAQKRLENRRKEYVIEPLIKIQSQKPKQDRRSFWVAYERKVVSIDGQIYQEGSGSFCAGFIDPFNKETLEIMIGIVGRQVSGLVQMYLEEAKINLPKGELHLRVLCYVKPIVVPQDVQAVFTKYEDEKLSGFRISNHYLTITWPNEVQIDSPDLQSEIVLNRYNFRLGPSLRKPIHVLFKHLQLPDDSEETFKDFLRRQCPGLAGFKVLNWTYDKYLNVGMINL